MVKKRKIKKSVLVAISIVNIDNKNYYLKNEQKSNIITL